MRNYDGFGDIVIGEINKVYYVCFIEICNSV